jgi:hypothetical protein
MICEWDYVCGSGACMCLCACACACVCLFVFVCVCIYIYIYLKNGVIRVHVHIYMYTYIYTLRHMTHMRIKHTSHTYIQANTRTHSHAHMIFPQDGERHGPGMFGHVSHVSLDLPGLGKYRDVPLELDDLTGNIRPLIRYVCMYVRMRMYVCM